jgi:PPOX class probable F420-dependent enzyme
MCPSIRDHGGEPSSRQVDELLDELAVGPRAAPHLTTGAVIRCCLRARWSHRNQLARSRHPGIRPLRCSGPLERISAVCCYLLLTTFTKDGRPKPTPIWGVPEGDKLLVITDDGSWKTKRINNTPRVTLAKSTALGKPKTEEVEGIARVLPKSETRRVYNAVLKRYWYHAWWFYAHSIVRGGIDKVHVGLEIKPAG